VTKPAPPALIRPNIIPPNQTGFLPSNAILIDATHLSGTINAKSLNVRIARHKVNMVNILFDVMTLSPKAHCHRVQSHGHSSGHKEMIFENKNYLM
jgi:hypothetical protein